MTVKNYDHTIIDHTDVPTNPLPQHVRIATLDPTTPRTDRTAIRAGPAPQRAALIVERGPDVGSRFLLCSAGDVERPPFPSDAFLDEATVSPHRHAEPRWPHPSDDCADLGSSGNGTHPRD